MKFHDLVLLLDNRSERYAEAAVFARHLDLADVTDCVGKYAVLVGNVSDVSTFAFAYGNCWRKLCVYEKHGIVVFSSPGGTGPSGAGHDGPLAWGRAHDAAPLRDALRRAVAVPVDESVPYAVRQEHFALLRKREGVLHRNLLMEWREIAGAPPSSSGKWMTVDCSKHSGSPFFGWVKQSLWADVPTPDLSKCKMDLGLRYPFPGADAHPEKRGGELCVEGTEFTVSLLLALLANRGVDQEPTVGQIALRHKVDYDTARKCLRGLADWLKTQTWVDRHVQCEGCARRRTYKCAPPLNGSACPDRSVACNRYDDGPGDVTSEDCAKLEGICACKRCGTVFLASAKDKEGRPCVRGGHAVCPECACAWPVDDAPPVEKRCGTCGVGGDLLADPVTGGPRCGNWSGSATVPNGPPWENCRFWKPKEQKP